MPEWVPQVVPNLCSRCGAYWECELHWLGHEVTAMPWPEHGVQVVEDLPDMEQVEHGPVFSKDALVVMSEVAPLREAWRDLRHAAERKLRELEGTDA